MDNLLEVAVREIAGKKNRFLRRQGMTPVHVFGKGIESLALQCDTGLLKQMIASKGTTRLLEIKVGGEAEPRNVFIGEIQRNPLSGELTHVDFHQINRSEKIRMAIPIVLTGEAPILKLKNNFIEQIMNELEVDCLPGDIPPHIEVDLSVLESANQAIHVGDLKLGKGVEITAALDQIVVKVSTASAEEEEEEEEEETTAAAGVPTEEGTAEPAE